MPGSNGIRVVEHLFEYHLRHAKNLAPTTDKWPCRATILTHVLILLPPSEKKAETTKPTPAMAVYSGVLYQALGWATLSPAAKKRGDLWNANGPHDWRIMGHLLRQQGFNFLNSTALHHLFEAGVTPLI